MPGGALRSRQRRGPLGGHVVGAWRRRDGGGWRQPAGDRPAPAARRREGRIESGNDMRTMRHATDPNCRLNRFALYGSP